MEVNPHSKLLEMLFAHKRRVSCVFNDVLGLYEIHHISLAFVDKEKQLCLLSSSPSLEFNLFNQGIWKYDRCYQPAWFQQQNLGFWPSLYEKKHFDALYYLKQAKPKYPIGLSLAGAPGIYPTVFSFASSDKSHETREQFCHIQPALSQIGLYCTNLLLPILQIYSPSMTVQPN